MPYNPKMHPPQKYGCGEDACLAFLTLTTSPKKKPLLQRNPPPKQKSKQPKNQLAALDPEAVAAAEAERRSLLLPLLPLLLPLLLPRLRPLLLLRRVLWRITCLLCIAGGGRDGLGLRSGRCPSPRLLSSSGLDADPRLVRVRA